MNRSIPLFLAALLSVCVAVHAAEPAAPAKAEVTAPPEPAGMVSLFNGKDLTGWDGDPRLWSVKDGAIHGETTKQVTTKGNTFLIYTGGEVGDFELRLTYRLQAGNSGVQYRSKRFEKGPNKWVLGGYQGEIANEPGRDGYLYQERGRGRIDWVGEKVVMDEKGKKNVVGSVGDNMAIAATFHKDGWNDYIIIAKGNHIVHYMNGVQTIDFTDNDPKGRTFTGLIGLQIHAGSPMQIDVKNIRLKKYDTAPGTVK